MVRIVIKVGSSTLSRNSSPPDAAYIADLARQLSEQRAFGHSLVLVSSGAIPAGMARLDWMGRPRSIPQKQAAAAVGQGLLMHAYSEAFAAFQIPVAQILLTREDLRTRARYLNARNTFDALLQAGALPIVNENDTVASDEIRFGDNDTLAALVASMVEADTVILLSDIEGLYDRHPGLHSDATLIPVVRKIDRTIELNAGEAGSSFGTGGMATKISAAKICVGMGIRMIIADGRRPNVIGDALAGRCGTLFTPAQRRLKSRQRWIAHGLEPKGGITVNPGAQARLVDEGKSLLPAGVTEVTGQFQSGDLVRVLDSAGDAFAQGFVNYSNQELALIMGHKSSEIASLLGSKRRDEVIHRDDLVVEAES